MSRTRAWLVVSPVLAAGVLVAHTLAYRVTGTRTDAFHAYLAHVPQILLIVTLGGLVLGGVGDRLEAPRPLFFVVVATTTFAIQEHVERLVHGAGFPLLLTTPAFLVGLLLQIPAALLAWLVARWLLLAVHDSLLRRPRRPCSTFLLLPCPAGRLSSRSEVRLPPGRGPPSLLSTC